MHRRSRSLCSQISKLEALNMSAQNCVSWLFSVWFLYWPVLWMPEEKVKEGEVSTKFYNFLAKQISRNSDYYWRFYSNFLVNTSKANISEKINLKLVGRKSLRSRGGNKFLFCPTTKNFKPIGVFLTILEALSCKTKYRKYLAKYPFPGIHICLTYFQYCNNEPDIPKSSIKQLWNLDPRYTSISPRSAIESYTVCPYKLVTCKQNASKKVQNLLKTAVSAGRQSHPRNEEQACSKSHMDFSGSDLHISH